MSDEAKHTDLGEAKEVASRFAGIKNSPLGGGWGPDGLAQYGTLRALIAIAEQLRVANLIALGETHRTVHVKRTQLDALGHVEEVDVPKRVLLPDITAILGLDDDHE